MRLNLDDADMCGSGIGGPPPAVRGEWLVGNVIKFPDEGRIVRFGRAQTPEESATVIILPVIRIERHNETIVENAEPRTPSPAHNGGRRGARRR